MLVEEMGKYGDRADHDQRILVDEEDKHSWPTVALAPDGSIAVANRLTWAAGRSRPARSSSISSSHGSTRDSVIYWS